MARNIGSTPAAGSELERCLYFCIKAAQAHYSCKSPVLSPGDAKWVATLPQLITAQNNATYEAVMEVIGEDETRPKSWSNKVTLDMEWRARQIRNHFRAELRQSIAKIFGKEPSDE